MRSNHNASRLHFTVVSVYWHTITVNRLVRWSKAALALVCTWMGDRSSMSIFADSPLDETLNRGPHGAALAATE